MIKSIKLLLGLFLLIGIAAESKAQNGSVSSGGVATGSGGTASYTVGEAVYTTISGKGGFAIEGLQQAYTATDLPISLLQFTAFVTESKEVEISWATVSEFNNQYFTVERSKYGELFEEITKVQSLGNSINKQSYQTTDSLPLNGVSFYRLKQTDVDGKTTYSSIVSISIAASESVLTAYPNPTVSYLNLQIANASAKKLIYAIYSLDGKLVVQQKITDNLTTIGTSNLVSGTYILRVANNNAVIKSFKIIKN